MFQVYTGFILSVHQNGGVSICISVCVHNTSNFVSQTPPTILFCKLHLKVCFTNSTFNFVSQTPPTILFRKLHLQFCFANSTYNFVSQTPPTILFHQLHLQFCFANSTYNFVSVLSKLCTNVEGLQYTILKRQLLLVEGLSPLELRYCLLYCLF